MNTLADGASSIPRPSGVPDHQVGRYRLIAGIGRGGMADVYLAVYANADAGRFQKLLVVKLLKPEMNSEPEFVHMFLDEARLAARLNHPNVVQTLEVGDEEGQHFLAMEYVEGQPLNRVAHKLNSHPAFDVSARLTILLKALAGLDYAHELLDYDDRPLNVVHRDISPGNILVGYDGQVKLVDFGIAKAADSSTETRVGMFKGKLAYMAPEQARAGIVDRRADVYAAGVVLWELLTGRRMWQGATQVEILSKVMAGEIIAPSRVVTGVHPDLERICLKALALDRDERYHTAAEFAADLEAFQRANFQPKNDRELGRLVAEAFATDRARIREIIEQQLTSGGRKLVLPTLATVSDTGSHSQMRDAVLGTGAVPTEGAAVEVAVPGGLGGAPGGIGLFIAAAAALMGVVAGLFVLMAHKGPAKPTAEVPTPSAEAQPKPEVAPPPAVAAVQQQGVTPTEITLGMSAVFSGPNRQLGEQMKLGVETAFFVTNSSGGIHGRKLQLVALDDGYEATKTAATMQDLLDQRKVFAIVGNVGTPTSVVAAPLASQKKTLFFGAFTGAPVLRQDPPDRYVFNYRASYREETAAAVKYLVDVHKIALNQIVVFAQEDSFGDAGYEGVIKAARQIDNGVKDVLRVGYKRNTVDVDAAVAQVIKYHDKTDLMRQGSQPNDVIRVAKHPVKAVIMVATYRAAAKFIQKVREMPRFAKPFFLNVSFVGTDSLGDDLKNTNPALCENVYVTQVVPPVSSGATGVRRYREALSAYQPQAQPSFVSLEGYVVGSVFAEAVKRTGPELTTEKLIDTLEQFRGVDLGFGAPLSFSLSEHQGSHKVWGTRFDENCVSQPAELE